MLADHINEDRLKETLLKLVSIRSIYTKEDLIVDYLNRKLRPICDNVTLQPVPDCGGNIIGIIRGETDEALLLNTHMDTVEPFSGWTKNINGEEEDGRIYGLGALDTKGGLAALMEVFYAIKDSGFKPRKTVIFSAVCDEEGFSRGTYTLIESGMLKNVRLGIVAEPTRLRLMRGGHGRLVFDIDIRGRPSHGAITRGAINTIIEASKIVLYLTKVSFPTGKDKAKTNVAPLSIRSSESILTHPERCILRFDVHYPPGVSKISAKKRFVKAVLDTPNLKVKPNIDLMKRPTPYMEPYYIENEIVEKIRGIIASILGHPPDLGISASVNDANYLNNRAKIPTLVFGPSGMNEHAPDEYVEFDSVVTSAKVYATIVEEMTK